MIPKNRLKEFRLNRQLTQLELALLVQADSTTVSKHETGSRVIPDVYVKRYADVFKIETYELFMEPQHA